MWRLNRPRINGRSPAGGQQRPSWLPVGRLALATAVWTLTCGGGGAFTSGFRRVCDGVVPQVRLCAAISDTFDPWTVLEISPDAGVNEARKAYRKLAAKYHPDVDSSDEATDMFQKVVRALAIITGEDKELDETTLLTNAANNLRDNIEFQKERIERLKQQAAEEEKRVKTMEEQQKKAEEKRDQVSAELGLLGGGLLGLVAGGPTGLLLGAIAGIVLSKRNDSLGKVIRGTGTFTRGMVDAVNKAASNDGAAP
ncbi:dnajb14 [Symbiodinium sp. CCMP2456]|nr:dnajb14 [Symbiodinium sp. CCMP2456]